MTEYRFSVIVPTSELTHESILDAADALAGTGCSDASVRGHHEGIEMIFDRAAASFRAAMASAISDVESAGFQVSRVEIDRESALASAA